MAQVQGPAVITAANVRMQNSRKLSSSIDTGYSLLCSVHTSQVDECGH